MKNFLPLLLVISTTLFAKAQGAQFNIEARIEGIEKGDTLRFSKVILPLWKLERDFDIVVEKGGLAIGSGDIDHNQIYLMEYFPKTGKAPISDRRGKEIMLTKGRTTLTGQRDYIYYCDVENEIYDAKLREMLALEDSLGKVRGDLLRELRSANEREDSTKAELLANDFDRFNSNRKAEFGRLRKLADDYEAAGGSEYSASVAAQKSYMAVDEFRKVYEKLSPEVKKSYYGELTYKLLTTAQSLTSGSPAPDVKLTTVKGREIKFSDFRGKYLLIYNFGLCPGSFAMDGSVAKFYNENRDKVNVIGITESFESLKSLGNSVADDEQMYDMNIKAVLAGMMSHPWEDEVESSKGANSEFLATYLALGLPYFILISPEGNIISRQIGDSTFNLALSSVK